MAEFVWKCPCLFTTEFINENMHSHGRGKIYTLLNTSTRISKFGTTYTFNSFPRNNLLLDELIPEIISYFFISDKNAQ
jgi:hypothetical protein